RATFFRQSGWLMIAGIVSGMLMWLVHFLGKAIGPKEYGVFIAFLSVAMVIPNIPLQMVMAHQTAKALATNREGELAGMIRMVWLVTFVVWLLACVAVFVSQAPILERWQIANPAGFWFTMFVVLFSLWMPVFLG